MPNVRIFSIPTIIWKFVSFEATECMEMATLTMYRYTTFIRAVLATNPNKKHFEQEVYNLISQSWMWNYIHFFELFFLFLHFVEHWNGKIDDAESSYFVSLGFERIFFSCKSHIFLLRISNFHWSHRNGKQAEH